MYSCVVLQLMLCSRLLLQVLLLQVLQAAGHGVNTTPDLANSIWAWQGLQLDSAYVHAMMHIFNVRSRTPAAAADTCVHH